LTSRRCRRTASALLSFAGPCEVDCIPVQASFKRSSDCVRSCYGRPPAQASRLPMSQISGTSKEDKGLTYCIKPQLRRVACNTYEIRIVPVRHDPMCLVPFLEKEAAKSVAVASSRTPLPHLSYTLNNSRRTCLNALALIWSSSDQRPRCSRCLS
jgi:hypothetical protein